MKPEIGNKYLITTDEWFVAPDGNQYRAAFGTVNAIFTDEDTLGIKTNRASTNWYISIGNMLIAGCCVHYCVRTDEISNDLPIRDIEYQGVLNKQIESKPPIYNADTPPRYK